MWLLLLLLLMLLLLWWLWWWWEGSCGASMDCIIELVDAAGSPVAGLFDDDLDVDLDDFFLFADHFGRADGEEIFDVRFDLDGDGTVDLDDFFTLADHFGQVAVSR